MFGRPTMSAASASDRRKATERSVPRRCAKELFRGVESEARRNMLGLRHDGAAT
jgi:hypothetical protein